MTTTPLIKRSSSNPESQKKVVESIGVSQKDLGRAYQYSKSKMSNPSDHVDEINIPEIEGHSSEFVYNYYVKDERTRPFDNSKRLPLQKIPRYVTISWSLPQLSEFEIRKEATEVLKNESALSIERNAAKIISEDNFFNPGYINHTFSSLEEIEQGASDLEKYSIMSRHDAESVFKMSKYQIQEIAGKGSETDEQYQDHLTELSDSFSSLADLPKSAIGLRVYDEKMNLNDKDDLLRSITDSLTLTVKLNKSVIPDFFKNSKEKSVESNLKYFQVNHSEFLRENPKRRGASPEVEPVYNDYNRSSADYLTHPTRLTGYIVDRYVANQQGFFKDKTFYIEDVRQTRLNDTSVLYGVTYIYAVRVVADVKVLTYSADGSRVDISSLYVSSRPTSIPVECYEYTPPPEPNDIRFFFDYNKRNLKIVWDIPVNPQRDVKQFQVMRRKSIKEPFELIAQYCFDNSDEGPGDSGRYKTGERIDGNNLDDMLPEDRYLVTMSEAPVFLHVDEDFTVDTEFYESSAYIYAICSVDAHGIISNYSAQHHVTFDPYKNRIVTSVICDAGSPRPYPNLTLRTDAFKDVIRIEGESSKKMQVYFTPEYLSVKDDRNAKFKIVEAQRTNTNSHYLIQMINLDNQKTQLLRINVKDPQRLT